MAMVIAALGGQRAGEFEGSLSGMEEAKKTTGMMGRTPSRSEVREMMRATGIKGKPTIQLRPMPSMLAGAISSRKSSWPKMR